MDEATRLKAFEPFFSTKAPGEGSGLGLALVHGMLQDHRGSVELVSMPASARRCTASFRCSIESLICCRS
jgi:signal transduction histidine kinase